MLPNHVTAAWRGASKVRGNLAALSGARVDQAWRAFGELAKLPPDGVQGALAATKSRNRDLAVCLLAQALDLFEAKSDEQAEAFAEWSKLVAQYADNLNKADCLQADAAFLIAAIDHRSEPSARHSWEGYDEAERLYRAGGACDLLVAIALFAQAWVALELGLLENRGSAYLGAKELFAAVRSTLSPRSSERAAIEACIDRGMAQSDAIAAALRSADPLQALRGAAELIDEHLLTMLRARVRLKSLDSGTADDAMSLARLCDQLAPGGTPDESMRLTLANTYMTMKSPALAEPLYRELLRESPQEVEPLDHLAAALAQSGKEDEARRLLETLIEMRPESSDYRGRLGVLLYRNGDTAEAAGHLRLALAAEPSNSFYRDVLDEIESAVSVSFNNGKLVISGDVSSVDPTDLAAGISAAFLAERPEEIPAYLQDTGKDPEVIAKVRALLAQRGLLEAPGSPAPRSHLAAAEEHFRVRDWQGAAAEYRLAIDEDEGLAPAYMGLGDVHYNNGEYYLAMAYFEESIEIQPAPSTWRFLGDSYRRVGLRQKAMEAYRQALEMRPDYHGARVALEEIESSPTKE